MTLRRSTTSTFVTLNWPLLNYALLLHGELHLCSAMQCFSGNQRQAMRLRCTDLYRTAIVPIGVAFALVLWMGNAAYLYLSVSFIQMIKALMPLSVRSSTLMALTAGSTAV